MDPLTQGIVGAITAQSITQRSQLALAAICGALAGMAADLDVLIHSTHDPLLALEFHRQFTHSLFFIPIGGALCATIFWWVFTRRSNVSFKLTLLWSTLGYATHGLLDGCTSYGTQLLWPLSDARYSIDIVSVIDPLFTLPALACLVMSTIYKRPVWVLAAVFWCVLYLFIGFIQHNRAITLGTEQAQLRGHTPVRLEAKPSFANLMVWKIVYEAKGRFFVLAVRPGWKATKIWEGDSVQKLNVQRDLPWLDPDSQQAKDISRFSWFSSGFIALDRNDPTHIVDMRYSLLPDQIKPLWWIKLSADATSDEHVHFETGRGEGRQSALALWKMITGK